MKRRTTRRQAGGPDDNTGSEPGADDGAVANDPDDVSVWGETWAQTEEERVARWLRARTTHDPEDRPRPDAYQAPFGAEVRDEAYRIDLAAAVDRAEGRIERSRREAVEAQAALEAEIQSLEGRRQRLVTALEAQQAEYDQALEEHTAARGHLQDVVTDLEAHSAALAAELATAEEDAEAARSERLQRMAELHGQAGALEEERRQLAAMVETEDAEAKSAHEARVSEVTGLASEVAALRQHRAELRAAVAVERAEAEEANRAAAVDAFPAGRPEPAHPLVGADVGDVGDVVDAVIPLHPSGRLAEAVAELGRHLAAELEAERSHSARLAREQDEARARLELESDLSEDPQSGLPQPVSGAPRRRGGRRRGGRGH